MLVLVSWDGKEETRSTLESLRWLPASCEAEFVVLHVVHPWADASSDKEVDQLITDAERRLDEWLGAEEDVTPRVEALEYGDNIASYISRRAVEMGADFVVVASKHATGVRGTLLGSAAQRLLHECPVPVMVVRPLDRA